MTVRVASLVISAAFVSLSAAQLQGPIPREKEPPSQSTRMREKQLPLTVTGCIRGKRLLLGTLTHSDSAADLLNADELLLEGTKDLMQQLRRDHDNHEDELTGIAILKPSPDGSTTTDVESKPIGKQGHVTLGVRESSGPTGAIRQPVRFRVTGLRHITEGCSRS